MHPYRELSLLLEDYRAKRQQLEAIAVVLEKEVNKIPHIKQLQSSHTQKRAGFIWRLR